MPGGRKPQTCLSEKSCQLTSSVSLIQMVTILRKEPGGEKVVLIFGREQLGDQKMVAYAFYIFEEIEKVHFTGLLPGSVPFFSKSMARL